MGEIADMMLDGTLCEACGSYIEGDGEGFPRYCSDQCARDRGADQLTMTRKERHAAKPTAKVGCPICDKRVKRTGLADHIRDAHAGEDAGRRLFVAGFCAALGVASEAALSENRSQALAVAWATRGGAGA